MGDCEAARKRITSHSSVVAAWQLGGAGAVAPQGGSASPSTLLGTNPGAMVGEAAVPCRPEESTRADLRNNGMPEEACEARRGCSSHHLHLGHGTRAKSQQASCERSRTGGLIVEST